jgi:hypothetical protein
VDLKNIDFGLPRLTRELAYDKATLCMVIAGVVFVLLIDSRPTPLWILCLTSPTASVLASLCFVVSPIDPYHRSPIRPPVMEGDIRHLLVIKLRSKDAKRYSLELGLKMAPCTTSLSLMFAYAWGNTSWNFPVENAVNLVLTSELLLGIACFCLIGQLLLRWGIREVVKSQAPSTQENN